MYGKLRYLSRSVRPAEYIYGGFALLICPTYLTVELMVIVLFSTLFNFGVVRSRPSSVSRSLLLSEQA